MKQEFKAGDKVYCPSEQVQIYTLRANDCGIYPLIIKCDSFIKSFTLYGHRYSGDPMPSILHATPENHELLCKLYGVEFEAPPKPKTPKEVIQAMLDDEWEYVPLLTPITDDETEEITRLFPVLVSKSMWQNPKITHEIHALLFQNGVPVDPKTGKIIIDYIDGEIVTEQS